MMEILSCENLRKVYGSGENQVVALDGIDLSLEKGEFVALVGASGSGKSTLLHIIGSVDKPTEGKVVIEGTDISKMNRTQAALFRRRKVGLVYQFYNLIPTLTVRKNILMPLLLDKKKPNQEYFEQVVNTLGITDKIEALPSHLSGGQQQRVAIARSLIYSPAILLADEPTGNLDQKNSKEIIEMLKISNRTLKQTILLITHDEKIAHEDKEIITLQNTKDEKNMIEIPVIAYTQIAPILREEYDNFSLVQFMPLSLWKKLSGQIEGVEADTYILILARSGASIEELDALEDDISQIIGQLYVIESENRIEEKITNDNMISGFKLIIGALCSLLAGIGISNVFSYTLGFLRQRKREFAQYMSVGLTPSGMQKVFFIEALVIAGRPLFITLPLTVLFVAFATKASYLDPLEFLIEAPIIPVIMFSLLIFSFVALAYYISGKRYLKAVLLILYVMILWCKN